jgi:hypothetical protein
MKDARSSWIGRPSLVTLALAAALLGALVSVASAQKVILGNIVVTIDGKISPSKLPRRTPAPIKLQVSGTMGTTDATHVPPLKEVFLEFDRNGHLNTTGLASCTVGKLQATLTARARKVCGAALLGSGRATAEIAFPEQPPFSAGGPLLIFNGSKGHKQMLIFHVYAKVPAPTTFVTTAVIGKGKGPYGTSARVRVPSITGGQGSVTSFTAQIKKIFRAKGKKQSVLTATCKTGSLRARGEFTFVNGKNLKGGVTRSCTPKG